MSDFEQSVRVIDGKNGRQLLRPAHWRHRVGRVAGAQILGNEETMETPNHGDAASDRGLGIAALVQGRDVIADAIDGDFIQSEVLSLEPSEIAVKIIRVSRDGSRSGAMLCHQRIEPELAKASVRLHAILPVGG